MLRAFLCLFCKRMPKIDINRAAEIMKKNHLEPEVLCRIIEEMNLAVQPDSGAGDEPEPVKKQYVILISQPAVQNVDGPYLEDGDVTGWVLQIPEAESPASLKGRIFKAAYDFNATKKGRLNPVKTVGEALEAIPPRLMKEADLWCKTKTPVMVLTTDNVIPKDTGGV